MQSGTRDLEKRVAATPASISMLQKEGYNVAPWSRLFWGERGGVPKLWFSRAEMGEPQRIMGGGGGVGGSREGCQNWGFPGRR